MRFLDALIAGLGIAWCLALGFALLYRLAAPLIRKARNLCCRALVLIRPILT